jgi:anhydro-N-acetylmuramic acid kinase
MPGKNYLKRLIKLKSRTIIGLNSGTSADGVDSAIIRISGNGLNSNVKYIAGASYKYPQSLKSKIIQYADLGFTDGIKWLELDLVLSEWFAKACVRITKKAGLNLEDIDIIGSHGQTIRHLPRNRRGSLTLQIADPARIAVKTGITTVGDFRIADIASGGQGAPLTPIVNSILFRRRRREIGILNIGGIANISVISSGKKQSGLFGCDTGPGNMLIDYLARKLFKIDFDKNGAIALRGKVDQSVVGSTLSSRFYNLKGPKSAGREDFGRQFAEAFLAKCRRRRLAKNDILATASRLTVAAVEKCVAINKLHFSELILTGGGARNKFFENGFKKVLPRVDIRHATDYNYPDDYLEAISFAVLANEAICSNSYELRNVTGSRKAVVLGKICQA